MESAGHFNCSHDDSQAMKLPDKSFHLEGGGCLLQNRNNIIR